MHIPLRLKHQLGLAEQRAMFTSTGELSKAAIDVSSPNLRANQSRVPVITQKGLERIEAHLDRILLNQNLPKELQVGERTMLWRLRSGERTPQDIEFYLHELRESATFRQTGDLSLSHKSSLQWRNVTERDLFHQSVINANKELFPIKWRESHELNAHSSKSHIRR